MRSRRLVALPGLQVQTERASTESELAVRGGSWRNSPMFLRAPVRFSYHGSEFRPNVGGFRLVLEV